MCPEMKPLQCMMCWSRKQRVLKQKEQIYLTDLPTSRKNKSALLFLHVIATYGNRVSSASASPGLGISLRSRIRLVQIQRFARMRADDLHALFTAVEIAAGS